VNSFEIRPAQPTDIDDLVEMGREFFEASPFAQMTTWDELSFRVTIASLLVGSIHGSLLVAVANEREVAGMAASVIFPIYFNIETNISQEIFWFVRPEYQTGIGADLLDELEADSMRKGANIFMSACLAGKRDKALDRVYQRRGYTPSENLYMRKLSS
jgi:hypothetical protein